MKPLQGSNQRGEETHRLVVFWFEREPGYWHAACSQPLGQAGGFPKTGRCRDKGQCGISSLLESLKQALALDELHSQVGDIRNGREARNTPFTCHFRRTRLLGRAGTAGENRATRKLRA